MRRLVMAVVCLVVSAVDGLAAGMIWADVRVVDTQYFSTTGSLPLPSYSVSIENSSGHVIAFVAFKARFVTPDREIPWAVSGYADFIPGGIEPGETRTIEDIFAPRSLLQIDDHEIVVEVYQFAAHSSNREKVVSP